SYRHASLAHCLHRRPTCCASVCSLAPSFSPTTPNYSLSLHDALPISSTVSADAKLILPKGIAVFNEDIETVRVTIVIERLATTRSEEHTSELQSRENLVCRLLIEKKKGGAGRVQDRNSGVAGMRGVEG